MNIKAPVRISAIFLFLAFSGCNNAARHQRMAVDELRKLRDDFNKGACQSFYDKTKLQNDKSRSEWIGGCKSIRENLGSWQTLTSLTVQSIGGSVPENILVEGRATFLPGEHSETYWLESEWRVQGSEVQLEYFHLEGGGKEFALPHLPKPFPKLDPDKRNLSKM